MDEAQLKKILQDQEVPEVSENARKIAVNLALAEFSKKPAQGSSLLGRLTGMTNPKARRNAMEQKTKSRMVYGGMATAMAVVLITGVSVMQLQDATRSGGDASSMTINKVQFNVGGGTVTSAPAPITQEAAPRYVEALKEYNESDQDFRAAPGKIKSEEKRMMGQGMIGNMAKSIAPGSPIPTIAMDEIAPNYYQDVGRDNFEDFEINPIKLVGEEPVSTFSIDVDTASYSFVRRQLNNGVLPQKDAVRAEEMINYFDYDYPLPETKEEPFKPSVAVTDSPWAEGKKLIHIGIKGYDIAPEQKPRSNLVFLIDTSGSMNSPDKLPLAMQSFKMLIETLEPEDTIGIVVYAGAAGAVLEPTKVSDKAKIFAALDNLSAGGSTAGGEGIRLAYQQAEAQFDKGAVNRVILASDGDFNVGIVNPEELQDFVERQRDKGVFLSVLGFGQGNYNDLMMQTLAQNGNGVAAYIDNLSEARKVLVEEASSTLFPIAKDVKIQVEFNPAQVSEYRLIGYETRHLNREDFNNDAVDAGDIGAGHSVTAIYEITPAGATPSIDTLRYGTETEKSENKYNLDDIHNKSDFGSEYAFLKIRYKLPDENESKLITTPITPDNDLTTVTHAGEKYIKRTLPETQMQDLNFATAVAGFAQILQGGKYTGGFSYDQVIDLANSAKGDDPFGERAEFVQLVRLAKTASEMQPR